MLAWLLLGVSVVALVIVGIDTLRGHSPVDSINALRLVLRYLVLGLVLAIWIRDPRGLDGILLTAVVIAGGTQA